ncbi:protein kinase superfamily protein [Anaeramoeba flamelloides]|uniref:non-specific serine/threonine protein kinase n=1 Tax=Anaeramoeba flamelloides TaxID=1746091 RepID=A0ABQ8ZD52_9EUKA|nr:protein kinase superfamily protein [Anaeramoeba flamelloides]
MKSKLYSSPPQTLLANYTIQGNSVTSKYKLKKQNNSFTLKPTNLSYSYDSEEESRSEYKIGGYHQIKMGDVFKNRYQAICKIGWGFHSIVWLVYDQLTTQLVAMKMVKGSKQFAYHAREEIKIYKSVNKTKGKGSSKIIKCLDYFTYSGPNGKHYCLILELLDEKDLLFLMKKYHFKGIPIKLVKYISKQILEGIHHLHSKCKIIHTDLKPENIMLYKKIGKFSGSLAKKIQKKNPKAVKKIKKIQKKRINSITETTKKKSIEKNFKSTEPENIITTLGNPTGKIDLFSSNDWVSIFPKKLKINNNSDIDSTHIGITDNNNIRNVYYKGKNIQKVSKKKNRKNMKASIKKKTSKVKLHTASIQSKTKEEQKPKKHKHTNSNQRTKIKNRKKTRILKINNTNSTIKIIRTKASNQIISQKIPTREKMKSENNLLKCKIVDFGNSIFKQNQEYGEIQSRAYRSPEVVMGKRYNEKVDIWSIGCIIFELLTGDILFYPEKTKNHSENEIHLSLMVKRLGEIPSYLLQKSKFSLKKNLQQYSLEKLLFNKYSFSKKDAHQIGSFLRCLLHYDSSKRFSANECLNHPWLRKF